MAAGANASALFSIPCFTVPIRSPTETPLASGLPLIGLAARIDAFATIVG